MKPSLPLSLGAISTAATKASIKVVIISLAIGSSWQGVSLHTQLWMLQLVTAVNLGVVATVFISASF